ncbi:MAG: division/cell wall cluster transcriptional repressor MraZ [Myxococcota bacterium]
MLGVRGQFHITIDEKGRLSLPSRLRDTFRSKEIERLILTNFKGGIWGYVEDDWSRYEQALMDHSPFEQESLTFTRAFIAGASECEVDKQGRILLPPYLRKYAGLEKDIVVISVVDRLEIWSQERWEAAYTSALQDIDQSGGPNQLKLASLRAK